MIKPVTTCSTAHVGASVSRTADTKHDLGRVTAGSWRRRRRRPRPGNARSGGGRSAGIGMPSRRCCGGTRPRACSPPACVSRCARWGSHRFLPLPSRRCSPAPAACSASATFCHRRASFCITTSAKDPCVPLSPLGRRRGRATIIRNCTTCRRMCVVVTRFGSSVAMSSDWNICYRAAAGVLRKGEG